MATAASRPVGTASCGDGVQDAGEECDDGNANNNDACQGNCLDPVCGDGIQDAGEACDDGNAINTDACTNACTIAFCGDGITGPGEGCDDGNAVDDDACANDCVVNFCGDGETNNGEECDDGGSNSDVNPDACRTTCLLPTCGDSVIDTGEDCDDGNTDDTDDCSAVCTAAMSDDFSAVSLASFWDFDNGGGTGTPTATLVDDTVDKKLSIFVPAGGHDAWTAGNAAPRVMQDVGDDQDWVIETRILSTPSPTSNSRFHANGVMLENSSGDFMRFDTYANLSSNSVIAATVIGGSATVHFNHTIPSVANRLRVTRSSTGTEWTFEYSLNDGASWLPAGGASGSFDSAFVVDKLGVFAANSGGGVPAHTAEFDFFFIDTAGDISPEDP